MRWLVSVGMFFQNDYLVKNILAITRVKIQGSTSPFAPSPDARTLVQYINFSFSFYKPFKLPLFLVQLLLYIKGST